MPLRQTLPALGLGLVGLLVAAFLTIYLYRAGMTDAKDLTAIIGIFTGVTGTLVGTFLGLHAGAASKTDLRADRDAIRRALELALAKLPDAEQTEIDGVASSKGGSAGG